MTALSLDAHVLTALFIAEGAAFVTADGRVHFEGADPEQAHDDSALDGLRPSRAVQAC